MLWHSTTTYTVRRVDYVGTTSTFTIINDIVMQSFCGGCIKVETIIYFLDVAACTIYIFPTHRDTDHLSFNF